MSQLSSGEVSRYWIDNWHLVPTRSLQLAFETADAKFEQLTDFSLVLSILRNNPSAVPPELIRAVEAMAVFARSPEIRTRNKRLKSGRARVAATALAVQHVLPRYLQERAQGLHQYSIDEDYSLQLVTAWAEEKESLGKETEFEALGSADYLRILAQAIDRFWGPDKFLTSTRSLYSPVLGNVLRSNLVEGLTRKKLVKLLKKASRDIGESGGRIREHQEVVLLLSKNRIRVSPISLVAEGTWEGYGLERGLVANLLSQESPVHDYEHTILELEELLNSTVTREQDFQRFFERHPRFLLGTEYSRLIAHPILVREDEQDLIPDFILVPHSFSSPKIIDLKLPNINIARHQPSREGFLQAVLTARDQLLEYRTYFSSWEASQRFREKYGCDVYLPKIGVVIGRSSSFASEYERRKIESRVSDLEVITYDDVLERARVCKDLSRL